MSQDNMIPDIEVQDQNTPPEQEVPLEKPVSTFRLIATLAIAGALAGLLIVLVNQHTKPHDQSKKNHGIHCVSQSIQNH